MSQQLEILFSYALTSDDTSNKPRIRPNIDWAVKLNDLFDDISQLNDGDNRQNPAPEMSAHIREL